MVDSALATMTASTPTALDSDTWQEALTRRLRALVRTGPLHRVESSKAQRGLELGGQDLRALALRALDTIEHMGLGSGASMESQVRRGRITDAVQTARRARLRSIEYQQKLRLEALDTLPNKIRLRNMHRDRRTGHHHVTHEEEATGHLEAVRALIATEP